MRQECLREEIDAYDISRLVSFVFLNGPCPSFTLPDGDALLGVLGALMRHAAWRGAREGDMTSNLADHNPVEDFFDAVEFQ